MFKIARDVTNSDGEVATVELVFDSDGLTITVTRPAGTREMLFTQEEASNLYDLLSYARPAYRKMNEDESR